MSRLINIVCVYPCNKVLRLRLKRGNGLACLRIIYKICLIDVNDQNIAFPNIGTFPACPFNKVLLLRLKRLDGLADLRIIWKIRLINVTDQNISLPSIGWRSLLLSLCKMKTKQSLIDKIKMNYRSKRCKKNQTCSSTKPFRFQPAKRARGLGLQFLL